MFEAEKKQAAEAFAAYKRRIAEIAKDTRLSQQGKAEQEAAATIKYQAEVKRLQGLAQGRVDRARAALPERRATAALKRDAILDGILSQAIRYDLLRRRIETMTPIALVQAARAASDDWSRAILVETGRILHSDDPGIIAGLDTIEASTPWGADTVAVEAEARQLEADAAVVPMLDVLQARQDLAGRVGVRAENLPADYPFPG